MSAGVHARAASLLVRRLAASPEADDAERRRRPSAPAGRSSAMRRRASSARSSERSIAARNASTPKWLTDSQTFSARNDRAELQAEVAEVDLALVPERPREVVGHDRERLLEQVALAHQQRAALDRLVEPLVRVERDRVRQLDARAAPRGRVRSAPRSRRRRASTCSHTPCSRQTAASSSSGSTAPVFVAPAAAATNSGRGPAAASASIARRRARRGRSRMARVGRQHPHLVGAEAEQARRARERRVRLVGRRRPRRGRSSARAAPRARTRAPSCWPPSRR